mmetsp:Transcript_19569/g.62755  ORF Transcript_19569/g.62755 Transcript_19569/m.62755 type:complete len:280 (-) Transcript_19569:278-1117(-)
MERAAGGARVCAGACGRTTARPPPRSRSALSVRRAVVSPLQPRRRGRRARCSARRLPKEREPLARRVRLRRRRRPLACRHRCRLVLRDETLVFTAADALAATLRSAVRSAAVAAARSPRPAPGEWTRRYLLPSAWHARLSLGDALPAGPRRSPLPRRRLGERCRCSLQRALWRRVRPHARRTACACMPEAICGRAQSCRRRQYPGAALLPRLSWLLALPLRCPRAARRAGDTIAARAPAAGARHHPASLRGGAASARVCVRLRHSRGRRRGCRHRHRST